MRVCAIAVAAVLLVAAAGPDTGGIDRIRATWGAVSFSINGAEAPPEAVKDIRTVFKGNEYTQRKGDLVLEEGTFKLDPAKMPRAIDFRIVRGQELDLGKDQFGIYEFDGETLRICVAPPGAEVRPTEFKTAPGSQTSLVVMKRESP